MTIFFIVLILFFSISFIWLILNRVANHFVFKPKTKCWPLHLPFEKFAICLSKKERITGVYLPAQANKTTFLFFHGRGGNISHFESFATTYAKDGYGIILFDYRGFGNSKGKPSQKNLFEDAISVARYFLKEKNLLPQNIVLYGHSLGNAQAIHVATTLAKFHWKGIVLQSPFLSAPDMAISFLTNAYPNPKLWHRLYKLLAEICLGKNQFNNYLVVDKLSLPTLICMSKADRTIPWQMTAKLAGKIPNAKRFLSDKGGHDEFDWCSREVKNSH